QRRRRGADTSPTSGRRTHTRRQRRPRGCSSILTGAEALLPARMLFVVRLVEGAQYRLAIHARQAPLCLRTNTTHRAVLHELRELSCDIVRERHALGGGSRLELLVHLVGEVSHLEHACHGGMVHVLHMQRPRDMWITSGHADCERRRRPTRNASCDTVVRGAPSARARPQEGPPPA